MKIEKWLLLVILCVGMSACNFPLRNTPLLISDPGPSQTWIDAPLPDSSLPMQPYKLIFHGSSSVGITEFELRINGIVIAEALPVSSSFGGLPDDTLFQGEYLWTPTAPGTYLIAVRAKGNGQFSSPDQVRVTVSGDEVELATPVPLVPSPTSTTSDEDVECTFTALVNLNCRLGPGLGYVVVDYFVPDQSAPVVGRTADSMYWFVIGPSSGKVCSVSTDEQFGEADGECSVLPMFTPIPLPTPTVTPTEALMGCTVVQPAGEIKCVVPCPEGAEPGEPCTP
jgi:hypothetical protein